jgi:hypothetical protein
VRRSGEGSLNRRQEIRPTSGGKPVLSKAASLPADAAVSHTTRPEADELLAIQTKRSNLARLAPRSRKVFDWGWSVLREPESFWARSDIGTVPGRVFSILLPVAEQAAGVAIPLLALRRWCRPPRGPGEESLRGFDEGVRTEWPAGTGVTAQQLIELLVVGLADERLPIGDQLQQRSHGDEGVVASRKVGRRARPWPILRPGAETRSHGVALYLPYGGEQVSLIHHEAVETLLPEMPFPALAKIDRTSISAVRLPQPVP